jgi:hypothetical protein
MGGEFIMAKGFQIGEFLTKMPQDGPIKQNVETEMMLVDIYKLKNNEKNPYDLEEIESLAQYLTYGANIPLIEVAKIDGEYVIWSGHRRTKAIIYGLENGYQYPKHIIDNGKVKVIVKDFDKEARLYGQGIYTADDFQILDLILPNKGQRRNVSVKTIAAEIDMLEPVIRKKFDFEEIKGSFRAYFAAFLGIAESNLQRYFSYRKLSPYIKEAIAQGKIRFTVATDHLSKISMEEQDDLVHILEQQNIDVTEKSILLQFRPQKEDAAPIASITERDLEQRGQTTLSDMNTLLNDDESTNSDNRAILENLGVSQIPLDKIPTEYGQLIILLKEKEGGFVAGFSFKGNDGENPVIEEPVVTEIPKEKEIAIKEEIDFLLEYGPMPIKEALYAGKYAIKTAENDLDEFQNTEMTPSASEKQQIRFEQIKSSVITQLNHISTVNNTQQIVNELKILKDYINQILSEEL